jgi:glycosyltransferase involved in cell wall biosynthesis
MIRRIFSLLKRIRCFVSPTVKNVDILFVNTMQKNGGAARAAYRTFLGIKRIYRNAHYLTLLKEEESSDITGYHHASFKGILANKLASLDRIPVRSYKNREKIIFTPAVYANPLRFSMSSFNPKIVHLHWVAFSMLKVENLLNLNVPIVWTLHDTWAFTGGCHYTGNCYNYQKQCGKCPQLGSHSSSDLSHSLWNRKNKVYSNINLTVVAPSHWLAELAKKSSLFKDLRIEVIPNGLDTNSFKPINKDIAKSYFNIDKDQPVLLFGAQWINDKRKGGDLLIEAIKKIDFPCTLLTFGSGALNLNINDLVKIKSVGNLTDNIALSMMYSAADVFICPSREDNLPNTVAESFACGTPCVAFNVNGLPDMVTHKETGWLANAFDPNELAIGIKWIVNHSAPEILRTAARQKALSEYSEEVMTKRYDELYKELLNKNDS